MTEKWLKFETLFAAMLAKLWCVSVTNGGRNARYLDIHQRCS